jgi:hypothetical protein
MADELTPAPAPTKPKTVDPLDEALNTPDVQHLYANGFALGLTTADVSIILKQFNRPFAVMSLSYTLAKTLSEKLARLVAEWETKTGQRLVTTDQIQLAFSKDSSAETKQ